MIWPIATKEVAGKLVDLTDGTKVNVLGSVEKSGFVFTNGEGEYLLIIDQVTAK